MNPDATDEPLCDFCGGLTGPHFMSDTSACGDGDGPGRYLCTRDACVAARFVLSAETRRRTYRRH